MYIKVSFSEVSSIIAALGMAIKNKTEQAEIATDAESKVSFMNAAEDFSVVQTNIQQQLDKNRNISVAVEVNSGVVQNVYANANISVEVYVLDEVSGDPNYAELRAEALKTLVNQPDWRRVL